MNPGPARAPLSPSSKPLQLGWALALLLLALAPVSTKVGGALWLMLVVGSLLVGWRTRGLATLEADDTRRVAWIWLGFCVAGSMLKLLGVLYWDDPIGTRHFEIRLTMAALAAWMLMRWLPPGFINFGGIRLALLVASVFALGVSIAHAYFNVETPSNRINWAGGLVMLAFAQIALMGQSCRARDVAVTILTLFLFLLSVLLTGARGAYLAIPWLVLSALWVLLLVGQRPALQRVRLTMRFVLPLLVLTAVTVMTVPKVVNVPAQRLQLALEEIQATVVAGDTQNYVNSPVFVRIRFWQRSWEAIKDSPWLGHGRERRIAMIQEWADDAGSREMARHIHVHNEYLNGWLDHGVIGLASTMCFMLGLFVVAVLAGRVKVQVGVGVLGIGVLHVLMSLTDTNTGTNNYGVMMSLSMAIILLSLERRRQGMEPAV